MQLFRFGSLLEDGSDPCSKCNGATGCSACKPGSFLTPDSYGQFKYSLKQVPMACSSCGFCKVGKCTAGGCTACEASATPMLVPGARRSAQLCIKDLCDDFGDPDNVFNMPINNNLWRWVSHGAGRVWGWVPRWGVWAWV